MLPISQLESDHYLRLLLQGPGGSGKTSLACALPAPFFIDIDGNLAGPVRYRRAHGLSLPIGYGRIDRDDKGVAIPRGPGQWARFDQLLIEAQSNPDVETIVMDSGTGLADIMKSETDRKNPSIDGRQGYNFFLQEGKRLMAILTSMQKNVVLTIHEKIDLDPMTTTKDAKGNVTGGTRMYSVNWPGQLGDYLSAFFTDAWRCEIEVVGLGNAAQYNRKVRTVQGPLYPGLKNSYELPAIWTFDWPTLENKMKTK